MNSRLDHERNRMQLGLFCLNIHRGGTIADLPGLLDLDWANVTRLSRQADHMGLEVIVPVARWKGFGGPTNYGGVCYDTFCWAAGLAAVPARIRLMSTVHMPTLHPLVAAKQLTTIDHISRGRIGVNVVGGWFRPELEMFGADMLEHDKRYELGEEWTELLRRLWTSDEEFDYDGEFFTARQAISEPKPLQRPYPPIMNAGHSPRGQRFAAQYADMVFMVLGDDDPKKDRQKVAAYKDLARNEFGREIEVWTHVTVIPAETDEAAAAARQRLFDAGDYEAVGNMLRTMGLESAALGGSDGLHLQERFVAGWGGPILAGDAETVASGLARLADAGADGTLLIFPDWDEGLERLQREVLPLMERDGLRAPALPLASAGA